MSAIDERMAVEKAMADIAAIGKTSLKPEYRKEYSVPEKAGMALGYAYRSRDIAELAYNAWEQMNAHQLNSVLNWCLGMYDIHERDTEYIKWLVEQTREAVYFDDETREWKKKLMRATVTFEEVTPE